ncbi:DEAD/DEAH box helicase [Allohahella sp. A8]|uniref:DEAD/DEAH box helicase n=1 Tax=Allohahella sp. A8 TaxID=3141461 RepID=UPI000C08E666|nr:ATP-dependent RNA helicase [Hahellaceae bacterium]|tara:strand:+ start:5503 stop:7008 length:1506 start_codon:yes stop_codon:yes gene_type:complete
MSFASLGLSTAILEAVAEEGYTTPSPIQAQAIPAVLKGRDVMAAAQTGTGKTAGFTLPLLEILSKGDRAQPNQVRALVLTPTRELAAQVAESVATYGKNLPMRSAVVFGGVKINPQMMQLRKGVDILVATPGRLLDLYNQNAVRFNQLEVLILDEADRMLDMGFIHDIKRILAVLPKQRQTLMFSATFSTEIRALAKGLVNDPVEVSVSPPNTTVALVRQWISTVDKKQKAPLLSYLIKENKWEQVLVFTKTKHGANKLTKYLEIQGIKAAAIHGNKSQGARTKALAEFKAGDTRVLVATDIAARGLDIDQLPQVVNFDLPNVPEDYVHRIGRTGRAGASGQAVSLVSADESRMLADIERLIKKKIPRETVEGFEPVHDVPDAMLDTRGPRQARPKRPSSGHRDGQRSGENAQGHKPASKNPRHATGQRSGQRAAAPGGGSANGGQRSGARPDGQRSGSGGRSDAGRPGGQRPQRSAGRPGSGGAGGGNRSPQRADVNGNR